MTNRMAATARFVSEADGFEARIDEKTGKWSVSAIGPDGNRNGVAFVQSYLDIRAPEDGSYDREYRENTWDPMSVIRPAHWLRMLRAREFFPDGVVVIDYEASDDAGQNLIY